MPGEWQSECEGIIEMKWATISLAVVAALAGAWYVLQPGEANVGNDAGNASPLPGDAMVAVTVPASLSE
jgi:hypothetical protein